MSQKKILFVVTSNNAMGTTGKQTGWYLPELAHPYHVFHNAGLAIDYVSPKGGKSEVDQGSVNNFAADAICKDFLASKEYERLNSTLKPSSVKPEEYVGIFYVGGHGPMWDTPDNAEIQKIAVTIYEEQNGVVGAVCHGPCGIVNTKLSDGKYLVEGKKVTGFSNAEEEAVQLTEVMPFLLESKLKERGAIYSAAPNWAPHVVVDNRLATGQNPASATPLAEAMVKMLPSHL